MQSFTAALAADAQLQGINTWPFASSRRRRRYDRGYSGYLEVLDAQRTLNEALLAFIRNCQAYLAYSVDRMNALGGGWSWRSPRLLQPQR